MFANPWALLWLLLAAPIVWLYRRRPAMPTVSTATGALWQQVFAEEWARTWWLPRREAVSLAVQLLILVAAVLALAEPRLLPPRTTIVIIDNSATMNAADVEPSRFEVARLHARRMIDSMADGDRLGLVTGGVPARVVCAPTGDRRHLRASLEAVAAGYGTAQATGAVAAARTMLDGHPAGRIVLLTDACFPEASHLAAAADVDLYTVGGPAANVAVRRVAARRHPGSPEVVQALVEVAQYSDAPLDDVPLQLLLDGNVLATEPVATDLGPHSAKLYEWTSPRGGILTVVAESDDVLPGDNRRNMQILPAGVHRISLVGEWSPHSQAVLASHPRVQLAPRTKLPDAPRPGVIFVLRGRMPPRLPAGPLLVVDPRSDCDLWQVDGTIERAEIVTLSGAHDVPSIKGLSQPLRRSEQEAPWISRSTAEMRRNALPPSSILAGSDLDGTVLTEVQRLRPAALEPDRVYVLAATAEGDPLLLALDRPTGRVVVLSGNPDTGELFHQAAFPSLVAQALDWLDAPAGRDGREDPVEPVSVFPACASLSENGNRHPACCVSIGHDQQETGAGSRSRIDFQGDLRVPPGVGTPAEQWSASGLGPRLWQFLGAAALAMLLVEWCLYQRRWIS